MKSICIATILCLCFLNLNAQERAGISVSTSSDTILMGNFFEVKFTVENFDGQFVAPPMDDFEIVGGPNQSSMMSIVNGKVSKSASYSYYLKPVQEGIFSLGSAKVIGDSKELSTIPIDIVVISNPDGIIQRPNQPREKSFDSLRNPRSEPSEPATAKRKTFRI